MIRFTCKECGKRLRKPDEAVGTLVFCECGQANRVPWESTVPPPAEGDEDRPHRRRPRDEDEDDRPPRRRRRTGYCLNHEGEVAPHTCADCQEPFCPRCVVELQGETLCGPCKDLRARRMQKPPGVPGLAIAALIAGLVSSPIALCLTLMSAGQEAEPPAVLAVSVVGALLGLGAVVLSLMALREVEKKKGHAGRAMALTGAAGGLAGLMWSASIISLMAARLIQG
jgi:hypothetical protein